MTGRRVAVPLAAVVAAGLAACTPGAPPAPTPSPLDTAAVRLEVEVTQSRTDRVARVVELEVRNRGAGDLTVERARLLTGLVEGTSTSERGRAVDAGSVRRLRVPLGPARCDADAEDGPASGAAASVELDVTDTAGRAGTVTVVPTDETDDLVRIHGEDCAARAVAAGLRLALDDGLVVRDVGGEPVAEVTLRVEPVPGGPRVRLRSVAATTLLRPAGSDGRWPVDVDSAAPPPDGRLVLAVRPARCDLHAIAEDKRGTVLGVEAEVDGVAQPMFYVAASDALRGALYDYVLTACGVPTDRRT